MQHDIVSEDGTLKYDFMSSLQKIVMARIVSSLWINQKTQQKIVGLYRQLRNVVMWEDFLKIEKYIFAEVSQLSLPNSICQELTYLVSILGKDIVNWIQHLDKHILIPRETEYSAVDLIPNIMWTTRGKIDYVQTAKNILLNSDGFLSDRHKLILACTYCLEDEIALLSSKFKNKFYLSNMMIEMYPMVYFWTAHITGDMTQLNNAPYYNDRNRRRTDVSYNEHIMDLLIKNGTIINDIPVRFMWNKLSKEEKVKKIALLFETIDNPDFIISLFSNLEYDQQQNILKQCSVAVLNAILKDWWWCGRYFLPTAFNVLDIIDPSSFWKVLRIINTNKCESPQKKMYHLFKSLFKTLWQEGSMQLKEFIFHDDAWSLNDFIIWDLNWEWDMDVIELIFKDLNTQQKKNIVLKEESIARCAYFIHFNKWDVLDSFIKCTLASEEDICQLKRKLMEHSGKEIAISFIKQREINKMEHFLNWAFKSSEEISNFHASLNYVIKEKEKFKTENSKELPYYFIFLVLDCFPKSENGEEMLHDYL